MDKEKNVNSFNAHCPFSSSVILCGKLRKGSMKNAGVAVLLLIK